ncbi:hypothetical protein Tb11.01.5030 [Trypanosoma brucei brucei TREU927]|uniref:T. brucei spp.-specific protein n=1 Tax=Trypanosoma brucei brucei (strain 927/4 GUTat10.1) TaxID=185431 RepID=Q382J4_TRYB2|nr:hypothetical protein Tb11.01.5030 [Trypanosoma brucei brucei TREU927]EAN80287.1 hypothetical protein Tb11.01.5030 [Trypanosoma brucei brucei TREU927]
MRRCCERMMLTTTGIVFPKTPLTNYFPNFIVTEVRRVDHPPSPSKSVCVAPFSCSSFRYKRQHTLFSFTYLFIGSSTHLSAIVVSILGSSAYSYPCPPRIKANGERRQEEYRTCGGGVDGKQVQYRWRSPVAQLYTPPLPLQGSRQLSVKRRQKL